MLQKEIDEGIFEARAQQFFEMWAPPDHRAASEFHRDLMLLVRIIYNDAQKPLLEHVTKLITAMPIISTLLKEGN